MVMQWPFAKQFPSSDKGIVASKHPRAGEAGTEMLRRGGSAVDAAVAASLASGVVEPYMSGVGGGGLALYQPVHGDPLALHFGMQAPLSARPDMYQIIPGTFDADLFGWPLTVENANVVGPRSVAIPGLVPGLHHLWKLGGVLPWSDLVGPAARLACGTPVDWQTTLRSLESFDLLSRFPDSRSIFLPGGRPLQPELGLAGETLVQADLARSLEAIGAQPLALGGREIADSIVKASEERLTKREITGREALQGESLRISFSGFDVHLVPWATGGPSVAEWLGIVQAMDPPADEQDPRFWWTIVKAGEVALRDRLALLGDPAFVPFPSQILQPSYHRQMAEAIKAGEVGPVSLPPDVGSTSHLAVVDEEGNAVTVTQTLLSAWGSGMVAPGTGICLNNGMMWFDPEPGRANSIDAGKLPLANMCPILVTRDHAPYLVYGASGGRRILSAVVQILMRVVLLDQTLAEAMSAPRLELSQEAVVLDVRLGGQLRHALAGMLDRPVRLRQPVLGASPWASPVGLMRMNDGRWTGGADPYTLACVLTI
jgi:gamma-glutamyltranspeptidase/glutathione hydrolase